MLLLREEDLVGRSACQFFAPVKRNLENLAANLAKGLVAMDVSNGLRLSLQTLVLSA